MIVSYYDEGHRLFVAYKVGRKWAHLLNLGSLDILKVKRDEYDRFAKPVEGIDPAKLARHLKRRAKWFKGLGLKVPQATIKECIDTLANIPISGGQAVSRKEAA